MSWVSLFSFLLGAKRGCFLPAANSTSVFRNSNQSSVSWIFLGSVSVQHPKCWFSCLWCAKCHVCVRRARIAEEEVLNVKSWSKANNVLWKGKYSLIGAKYQNYLLHLQSVESQQFFGFWKRHQRIVFLYFILYCKHRCYRGSRACFKILLHWRQIIGGIIG